MGRAPVINLQMRELICGLVSMGISRYRAARHVGVSRSTMYRTIKHDAEFARQVRDAELKQELSPLQQIRLHMPKDWRAAAWVAERQSTDWVKRTPDTVTMADMTGIFGAMMKLLLEGVRESDDRKQINQNFDKLFERICGKKRCSPRVRQAIKELEQDREGQQQARRRRPETCADEPSAESPPPNDPGDATSAPQRNVADERKIQRDEP